VHAARNPERPERFVELEGAFGEGARSHSGLGRG
jgi:hypothetical protein